MMYSGGARRSVAMLCKKFGSPVHPGHGYSTSACRGRTISEVIRDSNGSVSSTDANANYAFGMLVRRYATQISSSEQMNLIKQLRERTSAPIKDVKSSLVACDWDLGKSFFSHSLPLSYIFLEVDFLLSSHYLITECCRSCPKGPEETRYSSCI